MDAIGIADEDKVYLIPSLFVMLQRAHRQLASQ